MKARWKIPAVYGAWWPGVAPRRGAPVAPGEVAIAMRTVARPRRTAAPDTDRGQAEIRWAAPRRRPRRRKGGSWTR